MDIMKKVKAVEDFDLDLSEKVYPSTILLYDFLIAEPQYLSEEDHVRLLAVVKKYATVVKPYGTT